MASRNVDIRLLACLEALVTHRSVTLAAEHLNMSQPGMSNALARLRDLFKDPLLVRTTHGMAPTPRAEELAAAVRSGLRALEPVFDDPAPFHPATSTSRLVVTTTDYAGFVLFPEVVQHLNNKAPGMSIAFKAADPKRLADWLETAECDLVVGYVPDMADGMRAMGLFNEKLKCIARRNHPRLRDGLSLRTYIDCRHIVFGSAYSPVSTLEATLDKTLGILGLTRREGMRVPSMLLSPYFVANSDCLAMIPARVVEKLDPALPICSYDPPFEQPEFQVSMIWHERTHSIPAHRWLRRLIKEVAQTF